MCFFIFGLIIIKILKIIVIDRFIVDESGIEKLVYLVKII